MATESLPAEKTFRELRKARGYGQADIARELGVRGESVWGWEKYGRQPMPATLRKIAALLDVPIALLVDPAFWKNGATDGAD